MKEGGPRRLMAEREDGQTWRMFHGPRGQPPGFLLQGGPEDHGDAKCAPGSAESMEIVPYLPSPREGRKVTLELKGARDFEVRSLQTKARLSPQKLHAGGRRDKQPVKSLEPDGNQRHSSTFGYLFS